MAAAEGMGGAHLYAVEAGVARLQLDAGEGLFETHGARTVSAFCWLHLHIAALEQQPLVSELELGVPSSTFQPCMAVQGRWLFVNLRFGTHE